jgi:nucleotide-binding universal stress UspA family protein
METSIVSGVDGSSESIAALDVAAGMAERLGARLVLVHVVEPAPIQYVHAARFGGTTLPGPVAVQEQLAAQEETGELLLKRAAASAGIVDAEQRVAIGFPAERLADIADEENAELIVVGSRGRGAFKSAFLGSVSKSLVGFARSPVLIVPPGASES